MKMLWFIISAGFTIWNIKNTLSRLDESKGELFQEFWETLSPDEQDAWRKVFGNPPLKKISPVSYPKIIPPKSYQAASSVEILEAQI